ncbi:MAG: peptidase M24 family protein [Catenulispora sp. 13_1_20CM_3_70_7]|jgi:Xaa-Pro aminopeptidase|nr:aminopeptidase P family protein [Catenulisporales bacterium]OLE20197.1 MAG: peptidase M24 family protein [Catenulispora sp. 13_1_20CM_3_70_7]
MTADRTVSVPAAIEPDAYAARRERLRSRLEAADADAALVTKLVNVRYLTGFTGSNGAILITRNGAVFCTDFRYDTQAASEVPDLERIIVRHCAPALVERAAKDGLRRIAVEEHEITVEEHRKLAAELGSAAPSAQLVGLGHVVEELRRVKDESEIALIREACAISDRALAELTESILIGRTERHIAQELERRMTDHGADGRAFDTIVASGPHSAVPHHRPGERRVGEGEFLKIDFGAMYQGYHADVTRTFVVGRAPADWQVEVYDLVFAAQKAGRQALAPGVACADVDAAARAVITGAGFGEFFGHGLGHGVGLEIHEDPRLGAGLPGTLDDRTPVTIEPGVYLPGRGGVRIEDTLVVRPKAEGGPELLTITTKELLVL